MGDEVHHWGICPWREYASLELLIGEPVAKMQSGRRREGPYTLLPSRFGKTVLGYGSEQLKNLATEGKDGSTTGGGDCGWTSVVVLGRGPLLPQQSTVIPPAV